MPQPAGDTPKGDDYLRAFYQEFESTSSGYYRVWGRDLVDIECEREGYFPYLETLDFTTRAPAELDIYLEPLKEYTTWVNGTILDQDENPIPGSLRLLDVERDLYLINGTDTIDGIFNLTVYPGSFLRNTASTPASYEVGVSRRVSPWAGHSQTEERRVSQPCAHTSNAPASGLPGWVPSSLLALPAVSESHRRR